MGHNRESVRRVREEFANKRFLAASEAERRKRMAEERIPQLAEIDRKLSLTGASVFAAAMQGNDVNESIRRLKEENARLTDERTRLLVDAGFSPDYLSIRYECPVCSDVGYVGTKMCDCMRRALAAAELEDSGFGGLLDKQTFETFSLDYYTGVDRDTVARNVELLRRFAETFSKDTHQSWLLLGGTGLGKTHLSSAVAKTVAARGYQVIYDSTQSILSVFEEQRFGSGSAGDGSTTPFFDCDLLILDDLGTEMPNQFSLSCLYNLINARLMSGRPVIASTNLSQSELRSRYADRITSRLFGEYRPLVFMGRDIRAQKQLK